MKNFGKLAVLGAALAVSATFAHATPIALTGGLTVTGIDVTDDTFTTSSIAFAATNPNATVTGATGNLSIFSGDSALMTGFTSTSVNTVIFTDETNSKGLGFEEMTIGTWSDVVTAQGTALTISGTGEFFDTAGDTTESGTFILTSSDTQCKSTTCTAPDDISFGFTPFTNPAPPPPTVPEPSSLMLLGSGLVSGAGMLMRRRRVTV